MMTVISTQSYSANPQDHHDPSPVDVAVAVIV